MRINPSAPGREHRHRRGLRLLIAFAGVLAFMSAAARADVIAVPKAAAPTSMAALVANALRAASPMARVIELSGSASADAALIPRESKPGEVVYLLGPDAVVAAQAIDRRTPLVAINVPNPQRLGTLATYVSIYPRLEILFDLLSKKLGIKTAGVVFSPAQNHEVALLFAAQGEKHGMKLQPVPVSGASAGSTVKAIAPKVNAIVLLIDPVVFDPRSLAEICQAATAAKIPTIGFLPELPTYGVTLGIFVPPEATAAAAIKSAASALPGTKRSVEVDAMDVTVSKKSAEEVGLDPKNIGPHKIR